MTEALTLQQRNLEKLMSDVSEDCYAAGWMDGCEYAIWSMVVGDSTGYGMVAAHALPLDALRVYAEHIGFWIVWGASGPEAVPLAEWRDIYARRAAS